MTNQRTNEHQGLTLILTDWGLVERPASECRKRRYELEVINRSSADIENLFVAFFEQTVSRKEEEKERYVETRTISGTLTPNGFGGFSMSGGSNIGTVSSIETTTTSCWLKRAFEVGALSVGQAQKIDKFVPHLNALADFDLFALQYESKNGGKVGAVFKPDLIELVHKNLITKTETKTEPKPGLLQRAMRRIMGAPRQG